MLLTGTAVRGQSALDGFDPNSSGTVGVIVQQADGKILLGGTFTTLSPNGGAAVTRNRIARLNPDGTLDSAFDPNANGSVQAIVVQPGRILDEPEEPVGQPLCFLRAQLLHQTPVHLEPVA